jgi:hypothetical protein
MKFLALLLALAAAAPLHAQRPLLLFLHGRGHLDRDSARVRVEWERSLRLGVRELETGPLFDDADVRLVWYADVLDPRSDEGCRRPEDAPDRRDDGDESAWGAARLLLGAVAEAVEEKQARSELRGFVGDLAYLADPWKRCGVERRLASALADAAAAHRPVVLVSHSLGAVVAYRYLRAHGKLAPLQRWVTLGAPLGDPGLRSLLLGDADTELRLPSAVRSWVNVVREGDPFAAAVAPLVPSGGGRVSDLLRTGSSGDPHDLASYLKDDQTARAIVSAWCEAFGRGAPKGCGHLKQ